MSDRYIEEEVVGCASRTDGSKAFYCKSGIHSLATHDKIDMDKYKTKSSKLKLTNDHLKWIKEQSETMIGCIKKFGGFHPSVHCNDFLSFFVWPLPHVFGEKIVMNTVEEAIINCCTMLDSHCNYHSKTNYTEEDSDEETVSIANSTDQYND